MEQGIVIEIRGDKVLVETGASSGCGGCSASHSCAIVAGGTKRRLWMDNEAGARVGDGVTFDIAGKAVVASAAVLYLVPVIMLIAGIFLGAYAGFRRGPDVEMPMIVGGAAGLLVSVPVTWALSAVMKKKKAAVPRLLDITPNKGGINCG